MRAAGKALARQASANRHLVSGVIRLWPLNRRDVSNLRYFGPNTLIGNSRFFSSPGVQANSDSTKDNLVVSEFSIPANKAGLIIGHSGTTIRSIIRQSGAKVDVEKPALADGSSPPQVKVTLSGTQASIDLARSSIDRLISEVVKQPSLESRKPEATNTHQEELFLSDDEGGFLIGKGGLKVKKLMEETVRRPPYSAIRRLIAAHLPFPPHSHSRTFAGPCPTPARPPAHKNTPQLCSTA
jgi:hypothetical protein